METKIISIFTKKEDIQKIISAFKDYSFNEIKKHFHFEFSVMEKLTDLNLLAEIFPKFDKIKSIELRENDKKERHYSLNYELDDGTFVAIAIAFDNDKPIIVNGFHAIKNYKRFEISLRKNYGNKFI